MPGPKPMPTALKLLRGNPGKRALPKKEPQLPPASAPTGPPSELLNDARALALWQRLEPVLRGVRVLTEGDQAALIAGCQQWSDYLAARADIETRGPLVPVRPRSKRLIPNPSVAMAQKAYLLCARFWAQFGLTPADRTRVQTVDETGAGDLDTFLRS